MSSFDIPLLMYGAHTLGPLSMGGNEKKLHSSSIAARGKSLVIMAIWCTTLEFLLKMQTEQTARKQRSSRRSIAENFEEKLEE